MAGKSRRPRLVLMDRDRAELERLTRSRTAPQREAQRSAILLGYHAGESIAGIGRRLGMTRLSIAKWVAKALAVGPMAALKDNYHRPKEPVIGDDAKTWVVHVACSKPKDLGYATEVWSRQALARHIREHAVEAGFPALSPVPGTHPKIGRYHEYERLGTCSILAALDLQDGHITARVEDRHRSVEFTSLLSDLDARYPPECTIRIILDNHSAHLSKEMQAFLSLH